MNSLFDEIDSFLDAHHGADSHTKSIMHDRQRAACVAEIVFSSLFYADHEQHFNVDAYTLDCLVERVPLLRAHDYSGFYAFGDLAALECETVCRDVGTLADEDAAADELADLIQCDVEVALMCWQLAQQIAAVGWWREGDFTYDCMVQVGLRPMCDSFETVCEVKQ